MANIPVDKVGQELSVGCYVVMPYSISKTLIAQVTKLGPKMATLTSIESPKSGYCKYYGQLIRLPDESVTLYILSQES